MKKNTSNRNIVPGDKAPDLSDVSIGGTVTGAVRSEVTDTILKRIFFFSLLGMLLITWFTGFNVGYHQDEVDMNSYGKACVSYYATGGKDTTFRGSNTRLCKIDSFLKYYGCGFEYFAVAANKLTGNTGGKQEFNVRHVVNEFFGIVALLFTGLVARKLLDWRAALIAIWLAYLSPAFFGHSYFNTKDIPFCAGYIASLYYALCFLEELPVVSWKTTIKLMLAFAFTTDVRIAGILWIFYLLLFSGIYVASNRVLLNNVIKNLTSVVIKYAVVIFGGLLLVVLSWPFLLQDPLRNLPLAMQIIQKYPMKIKMNFGGEVITSLDLPLNYIPKLLSLTTPSLVMLFVVVGLVFFVATYKMMRVKAYVFLIFTSLFPLVYAIVTHAVMYSGWRHFLFIYPSIAILAALGITLVFDYLRKPIYKAAFGVLSGAAMLHPALWSIKNHPYEYSYFNELSGGFKNMYYSYDTDYWQISMKNAIDKMMKNEPIAASKDTIIIATNIPVFVDNYMAVQYPESKIKVINTGCASRNLERWTYAVFSSFLVKPEYLENYFPPKTTCYSESIDGLPVTVILKDTARLDLKALDALASSQNKVADSLFTAYISTTKDDNPAINAYMALAKASIGQNDIAITLAKKALSYHFSNDLDYNALCALGIAYANKGQFDLSVNSLNDAELQFPGQPNAKAIMNQVQSMMKSANQVIKPN